MNTHIKASIPRLDRDFTINILEWNIRYLVQLRKEPAILFSAHQFQKFKSVKVCDDQKPISFENILKHDINFVWV